MSRPRLSSKLFRAARRFNDIEAIASDDPERVARRAKNRIVGRLGRTSTRTPSMKCGTSPRG